VHATLLALSAVVYLVAGYVLLFIPLVWLITRGEPGMAIFREWALKPLLLPLGLILAPFGVKLEPNHRTFKTEHGCSAELKESRFGDRQPEGFLSRQRAKEYLVIRILAEAETQGVTLSDVERKMLYLSETDWTPPDIVDVCAEFERDYNDTEFEQKIAALVRNLKARANPEEQQQWADAVLKLSDGDHYLLVLIDGAVKSSDAPPIPPWRRWLPSDDPRAKGTAGDRLRLILVALAILVGIFLYARFTSGL
jgi:hypothetical protein